MVVKKKKVVPARKGGASASGARTTRAAKTPGAVAAPPAKRAVVKKATVPSPTPGGAPMPAERVRGRYGYTAGSKNDIVATLLVKGVPSRRVALEMLRERDPEAGWSVPLSTVVKELLARGFTEEGTWRFVPPAGEEGEEPPPVDVPSKPKRKTAAQKNAEAEAADLTAPPKPVVRKKLPVRKPVVRRKVPAVTP